MEEEKKEEEKYSKIDEETLKKLKDVFGHFPPALTADQNLELLERYKETGDLEIRNQIVCGNLKFAVSCSYKYFKNLIDKYYKNQHDELVQDLSLWLMDAIERFDTSKGFSFSTYAGVIIRSEFLHKDKHVARTLKNKADIVSFSSPAKVFKNGDILTYEQVLADKFSEEQLAASVDLHHILKNIVPLLTEREKIIFKNVFIERKTVAQTAKNLGCARTYLYHLIKNMQNKILDAYQRGFAYSNGNMTIEQAFWMQKKRNQEIIKDYFQGTMKLSQIAQKYGIKEGTVGIVIRNFKEFCQERNVQLPARIKPVSIRKKKAHPVSAQFRAERDKKILEDYLQGKMSKEEIGKKYSMTTANVHRIVSKPNLRGTSE